MKVLKHLSLLLIAAMVLFTVSCGGESGTPSNPTGFVRKSAEGYTEIYFDNMTAELNTTYSLTII